MNRNKIGMEITLNKNKDLVKQRKFDYWNDSLIQDFYLDYYNNLNSKELDKEFNKDIKILSDVLIKLPDTKRKEFIQVFSKFIEFYLENKIEKEIDNSIIKILNF